MNGNLSVDDYPDHLNPFDDNYDGIPEPRSSKQKYNTWSANRGKQVSTTTDKKEKPSFFEKPWSALNITPKGKLVRRMSFLKTTVARLSFRKKRHQHSEDDIHRSNSLHEDFAYRIISPKVKERLRLQALPALARLEQAEVASTDIPSSPLSNTRLSSLEEPEDKEIQNSGVCSVNSPESPAELNSLGVRPKTHKKKRPPPPPPPPLPVENLESTNVAVKQEDSQSATSSITQDLEKGGLSLDDDSLAEFEFDQQKLNQQYD